MRKVLMLTLLIAVLSSLVITGSGAAELRGLWVDAFHPGFRTPEQTAKMVAKAKACNFNALFVQVRRRGDVFYRSSIEPMANEVAAGYDPLADVLAQAHAAGLQVHAWITAFEVHYEKNGQKTDGTVQTAHPDWVLKDHLGANKTPGGSVYLDPGNPEVRSYLASVAAEIAKKYEVDGIHLDIVKYPGRESGYNDASVARFNSETKKNGKPSRSDKEWGDWRRTQIEDFVRAAYNAVKAARPSAKVSAAVFANIRDARDSMFQDWTSWLKDGLLDFAVPMVFVNDNRIFDSLSNAMVAAGKGKAVYIGQGGHSLHTQVSLEQIAKARDAGANGIVVFSYYYCSRVRKGADISLMQALKEGPFATPESVP